MGLVISTQGVIQSNKARKVVSQINADVLALFDARYLLNEFSNGDSVDKITLHGNHDTDYRYLRKSTNINNQYAPILTGNSLYFDGGASLRTNVFEIESEFTLAMVLKIDKDVQSGSLWRGGAINASDGAKSLFYSADKKTIAFRKIGIPVVSLPLDNAINDYFVVVVSCSKVETKLLIDTHIALGEASNLTNNYYQLMSGDEAQNKISGNLKYFSFYSGAATSDEMLKLQQILKQNFGI
ncbi:hypothetical protein EC844_12520 [Acinetobacter calcoaceticus]|uniref:Uncharacterized protein n=1 Tax=Acinetobacter calcoaceticus TaxID=471 RepID=A0A4R1XHN3_ACICA|nr:hypothetical protein EC844_12520 [Acinetobacter calcoaceticus]